MKNNVYDFYSKKNMQDLAKVDYQGNEEAVEELGRYVGNLPKRETKEVRNLIQQLTVKKAQIDAMIQEWDTLYQGYSYMLVGVLVTLNVTEGQFNPDRDDIYVGEDGHVWIVNREDAEAFRRRMEKK